MSVVKVLSGHVSPETAFSVDSYPYGFRLRCKIRYWIETTKHGQRVVSQTTNPKRPRVSAQDGVVQDNWNKPKASTYTPLRVLFLDEQGHVANEGLSIYADSAKIAAFEATFGAALTSDRDQSVLRGIKAIAAKMEAREAARKAAEATVQG